jgi:hypothetical protein
LSRRAVLGSARALTLTTIPAAAITVASIAPDADSNLSKLLKMEARLKDITDQIEVQQAITSKAGRKAFRTYRACPQPPDYSEMETYAEKLRANYYWERSRERYQERRARIDEETGYAEAQELLKELRDARDRITMGEIWDVQATCIQSLKCKARMARGGMSASLTRDVLALEV